MPELFKPLTVMEVESILDQIETYALDELEACIDAEQYEAADLEASLASAKNRRAVRELREQIALKLQLLDGYRAELKRRAVA